MLCLLQDGAVTDALLAALAIVGGWIGWLIKRLVTALLDHLKEIKPEIRMLRMAINNNTLQHEAQLDRALDTSVEQHEKTQELVREQGDRIVRKIEER